MTEPNILLWPKDDFSCLIEKYYNICISPLKIPGDLILFFSFIIIVADAIFFDLSFTLVWWKISLEMSYYICFLECQQIVLPYSFIIFLIY